MRVFGEKGSRWGRAVIENAAGNGLWWLAVLLGSFLLAYLPPVKAWLTGSVEGPGWLLVVAVVVCAGLGFLIGRQRFGRVPEAQAKLTPVAVSGSAIPSIARAPSRFQPGGMQDAVIRALRYADGWITFDALAQRIAASSQQDVRQALRGLGTQMWIESHRDNIHQTEGGRAYRLDDHGITYARERGFQTSTEVAREGANDR